MRNSPLLLMLCLPSANADDAGDLIRIASAPLSQCLQQLSADTGARFIVSSGVARRAPECAPVVAARSTDAALTQALGAADVQWHLRDDGVYLLARADTAVDGQLDALTITEDADGSADGDYSDHDEASAPRPAIADLASTTTYSAAELAVKPIVRFSQLSRLAPNVYSSGQSLSIRGVPRDNEYFTGNAVFLDGIDIGTILLEGNLLPVDELTSLRYVRAGSAFERGGGAAGGAIYLETPQPVPQLNSQISASVGEESTWWTRAVIGGGLGDSGLSGRLSVAHGEQPRFVRNLLQPALAGNLDTRSHASARLLYEPDAIAGLTASLTGFHIRGDAPERTVRRPVGDDSFDIFSGLSADQAAVDFDLRGTGLGFETSYRASERLTLGASVSTLDVERDALIPGNVAERTTRIDHNDRMRGRLSAKFNLTDAWSVWLAGEHQSVESQVLNRRLVLQAPLNGIPIDERTSDDLALRSNSLAIEVGYDAGRWRTSAGVRRIHEDVSFLIGQLLLTPRGALLRDNRVRTFNDYSRNLPVIGFEFDVSEQHQLGANFGRGLRSGGFSEVLTVGRYAPESLSTAELFWRAQWFGGDVTTTASVFRTRWDDRTGIDGTVGAVIIEPFKTQIDGAEFELEAALTEQWSLRAAAGWLDAVHTDGVYRLGFEDTNIAGRKAADAPGFTALLGLIWRGDRGWYASTDAYHAASAVSTTFVPNINSSLPPRRDAYTVVDARIGWQGEHLGLSLIAANLFDEQYIDRFQNLRGSRRLIGEPRHVQLRISWEF